MKKLLTSFLFVAFSSLLSTAQISPPAGIGDSSTMIMWLSPDTAVYNSSSTEASIGQTVFEWHDISGHGYVFENTLNSNRPELEMDGIFRYLDFTPGDFFRNTQVQDSINGLTEFSIFMVVKSDVTNTDNGLLFWKYPPDDEDDGLCLRYDANGANTGNVNCLKTGLQGNTPNNQVETSNNSQTTNRQILTITWKQNQRLKVYINGVLNDSSSSTINTALSGIQEILIGKGGKDNNTNEGWNGGIGSVVFYNNCYPDDTLALISKDLSGPIISAQTGLWSVPGTWECGCLPSDTDDVFIRNTHFVTISNANEIINDVTIDNGATLSNNRVLIINGDYLNNGTHAGNSANRLEGINTTVNGTGIITNTAVFDFRNGNKMILSTADLSKTAAGNVRIRGAITVTNNGSFSIARNLVGNNVASTWINAANSSLASGRNILNTGVLNASANGNTVTYNRTGTGNQRIKDPVASTYFNLNIDGNNINSDKRLMNDVIVTNDITITGGTFDVSNSDFSVNLRGDWNNTSGNFDHRSGIVTLDGSGQQTINHSLSENFFNLVISGSGSKLLATDIDINNDFTINSNLDVSPSNFTINLAGDWFHNGIFTEQNGTVVLDGTSPQSLNNSITFYNLTQNGVGGTSIASGIDSIISTLTLTQGNFNTNNSLIIVSNSAGTGRIAEITGGTISGDITMQRWIGQGVTGWRMLGSAVNGGKTLQDWNDDFITSGFPGSDYPTFNFTSLWTYDETILGSFQDSGWVEAANITDPINIGEGYWCYVGPLIVNLDVTGPPNTGNVIFPVSFTSSGSGLDDGWNLVSNPYPSSINWDAAGWTKGGMNNAIYVWDHSILQFTSYVGGFGTNGGNEFIGSSQAFWVQANSVGAVLIGSESVKSAVDATFFKQQANNQSTTANWFRLKIKDNTYSDDIVIGFNSSATNFFDGQLDAKKIYSADYYGVPGLATIVQDSLDFSVNTLPPLSNDLVIPLRTLTSTSGNYTMEALEMDNMPNSACLVLEDTYTNTFTDLKSDTSYSFVLEDTTYKPRFYIHISAPIETSSIDATCHGDSSGMAIAQGNGNGPWTYNWYDENDSLLKTTSNSFQSDTLFDIAAGSYFIKVIDSTAICAELEEEVIVLEPLPLQVQASTLSDDGNCSGSATALVAGGTSPYSYLWSDNNQQSTLTATGLCKGVYSVTVKDNKGCIEVKDAIVVKEELTKIDEYMQDDATVIQVFPNPSNGDISLYFSDDLSGKVEVSIIDITGREVFISKNISIHKPFQFKLNHSGVYVVRVNTENESYFKRIVVN